MTTLQLTARINETANEIIFQANCEASSVNKEVSQKDITIELDCALEFLSFENNTARAIFSGFVMSKVRKTLPDLYPRAGMDQNGNWTYDQTKWA